MVKILVVEDEKEMKIYIFSTCFLPYIFFKFLHIKLFLKV